MNEPQREDIRKLAKRAEDTFSLKEMYWQPKWDDVWEFTMPERNRQKGRNPNAYYDNVYDSTAIRGARGLANTLLAGLTPPWMPWFMLSPGPAFSATEASEMMEDLDVVNKILMLHFNLSNFIGEMQSSFLDCTVSTGAIRVEPRPSGVGVQFRNVPLDEIAVTEDEMGELQHIFHRRSMRAEELIQKYRKELKDEQYIKQLEEKPDEMIDLVAATITEGGKTKFTLWIKEKVDTVLEERTLPRNPYIVFRWSRVPGHSYGVGPAMELYGDNRYLNKIKELAIKNVALAVAGVYTGRDDGILNPHGLRIRPATVIPVASNDQQNPTLQRLDTSAQLDIAQFAIENLRGDIRKGFYADRFTPDGRTPQTATEIVEKAKIIAQELGATYGILEKELLGPLVTKVVDILASQGVIPEEIRVDPYTVGITFLSSLAQAQRLQEVDTLMQFGAVIQQMSQTDPRIATVFDGEKAARKIGELLRVGADVMRSPSEAKQLQEEAMQGMQMMQQMQGGAGGEPGAETPVQ